MRTLPILIMALLALAGTAHAALGTALPTGAYMGHETKDSAGVGPYSTGYPAGINLDVLPSGVIQIYDPFNPFQHDDWIEDYPDTGIYHSPQREDVGMMIKDNGDGTYTMTINSTWTGQTLSTHTITTR